MFLVIGVTKKTLVALSVGSDVLNDYSCKLSFGDAVVLNYKSALFIASSQTDKAHDEAAISC